MERQQNVQFNITLPKRYRDYLRTVAAKEVLEDPGKNVSAASIAAGIIIEHLDQLMEKEER
jgi:hypothetical protein